MRTSSAAPGAALETSRPEAPRPEKAYTSRAAAVFAGLVWGTMALGSLVFSVQEPGAVTIGGDAGRHGRAPRDRRRGHEVRA